MSEVVSIEIASIPNRVLTHRKQRKLTDEQVHLLLTEYVNTDTTYKALGEKFGGIAGRTVSSLVRGFSYRDVPGIAELRKGAQEKAKKRSGKWSRSEPVRVPDPTKAIIEVDFCSVESIDAAIRRLQAVRSLVIGPTGEAAA